MSIWKPTEKIKYINDDEKQGIKVDWKKVRIEYKKLKIPKEYYYPFKADLEKHGYVMPISDRSRGKTTNLMIGGLVLFKMYGIETQYVRQSKDIITPRMLKDLYAVVIECGYLKKLFGDKYNDLDYKSKRWRLIKRDTNGEVVDMCENHCTYCCSLDEADKMKSSYNAPKGDWIIFDEFINNDYRSSDTFRFSDICKTIIRERTSPVIFMASNTIDKNSLWFDELCIRKEIDAIAMGDSISITTELGTHIFLEMLEPNISATREKVNSRFWGFNNPKLLSITGKGEWATKNYPHIPEYSEEDIEQFDKEGKTLQVLHNKLFIRLASKYVKLRLMSDPTFGLCVYVTPATRVYDDSIILTIDDLEKPNEIFGLGYGTNIETIWNIYRDNLFFYSRNSEGAFVESYIKHAHRAMTERRV